VNVVPDLPNPGKWKASLHLDAKDYPRVDGSTATLPLAIYMRSKITGATLADSTNRTLFSTTGPAWEALANGDADLLVVYEAPDEIKQELKDDNADLTVKPIGMDALVFLTNKGNGVGSLTQQQIVDIYTGKIKNWSDVGGANAAIIPYQRISNSGSQALMLKLVMKKTKIMDAPEMLQPGEMEGLVDAIASYDNTNNALGYSVYYYVRNMYTLPGIKLLSVDGIAPTSDTIASGAYPYINPFYAVIRADEPAGSPAHKLFDWLTGTEGKRAVKDAGYVPAN
jgi:phosphate transport system substrate-binding protein